MMGKREKMDRGADGENDERGKGKRCRRDERGG